MMALAEAIRAMDMTNEPAKQFPGSRALDASDSSGISRRFFRDWASRPVSGWFCGLFYPLSAIWPDLCTVR